MKKSANVVKSTKENASAKTEQKIEKLNLSQFAERLSKIEVKEKVKKETVYIYPENYTLADINGDKGKRFRSSKRTALNRFCNNIFVYAKTNNSEQLKKEISSFETFYKENYKLNDYSINSLTRKADEKTKDIELMLNIIKEVKK